MLRSSASGDGSGTATYFMAIFTDTEGCRIQKFSQRNLRLKKENRKNTTFTHQFRTEASLLSGHFSFISNCKHLKTVSNETLSGVIYTSQHSNQMFMSLILSVLMSA
jgi:hypothetical protein